MPSTIKRKKGQFLSRKKKNSGQRKTAPTPLLVPSNKPKDSKELDTDTSPVKSDQWRILLGMRPPIEEAKIICNRLEAEGIIPPDQNWFKYPNLYEDKTPSSESSVREETNRGFNFDYDGEDELEIDIEVVHDETAREEAAVDCDEGEFEFGIDHVEVVQDEKAPEMEMEVQEDSVVVVQDKKAPELGQKEKSKAVNYVGKDKCELELDDVDFKVVKDEKVPERTIVQDKKAPELGLAEKAEAINYDGKDKAELELDVDFKVVQDEKAPEIGLEEKAEAVNYELCEDKGELNVDFKVVKYEKVQEGTVVQGKKAPESELGLAEKAEAVNYGGKDKGELDVEVVQDQDEKAPKSEEKNMQLIAEKTITASTTTSTSKDKDKGPPVTYEFHGSNMSFGQSVSEDNVSYQNVPAEDVIYDGPVRDSNENTLTVTINSSTNTNTNENEKGRKTVKPKSPIPDLLQPIQNIRSSSPLLVDCKVTSPEEATATTSRGFEINKGIEPLLNRQSLMPYSDSDSDTDDPDNSKEGQKTITITAGQPLPNRESFLSSSDSGSETDDPEAYYNSKEEQKTFTVTSSPPAASEITKLSAVQENLMDVSTSEDVDVEADFDVDIVQTLKDLVSKTDGMK